MQHSIKRKLIIGGITLLLTGLTLAAPVFTPQSQPTGWVSRPVVTWFDVSDGTENFYQLDYRKDTFAGNVLAFDINKDAIIQSTGPWDEVDPTLITAASLLNARAHNDRKIATSTGPFLWGNMNGTQQADLVSDKDLKFIRGERNNEEPNGLGFRQRESVMGDVLHSTINFWDDGTNQTLYVGSNDGMLHSFDANTGVENWAYIPSMVIPDLVKLTVKNYIHTHFVDGPINMAVFDIGGTLKTFLASGLGAGGAGLFALDVSTAIAASEQAVADKLLWEITPATAGFADLGHTYGTPQFTRLIDGTPAVVIGNGYVNTGSGHAVLYVIEATGPDRGTLIKAFDTGSGTTASPNGLSTPALVDTDGDRRPDLAYAGDIDGQVWKFDLSDYNSSPTLLFTTAPGDSGEPQAITTAVVVQPHPLGGQMVAFATGRILTSGDKTDTSVHYAYGIWDGAPVANDALLTQTLTGSLSNGLRVRTVTAYVPDWTAGSGHHYGWKVALEPGERVVGEKPFHNNGRFYMLVTNPTIGTGDNWLHELVFTTGGTPAGPIFDLNEDGLFNSDDLATNTHVPVAKFLGPGVFSQPRLVRADKLATTLYAFHPDLPITDGVVTPPEDPGVSGGHFDFDIYYWIPSGGDKDVLQDTQDTVTGAGSLCLLGDKDFSAYLTIGTDSDIGCRNNPDIADGYTYLTDYTAGGGCLSAGSVSDKDDGKLISTTCAGAILVHFIQGDYSKEQHVHEYDDKYDVTGVNMLAPSDPEFDLQYAITNSATEFKILVLNQYLNPAATLDVGGAGYESVKTYGNLASQTTADFVTGLPIYSRDTIGTLTYNLPLDAFKSKDWWGDGGDGVIRAGLMPTQTGCVNKVHKDGSMVNGGSAGKIGPQGERFDGAFTIQIILPETQDIHLELNNTDTTQTIAERARYGWRVKEANFGQYVLAEYTSFWHHPNHFCYGNDGWIPDPSEDFDFSTKTVVRPAGSDDPQGGVFGEEAPTPVAITDPVTNADGSVTTVTVYDDGSTYTVTVTNPGAKDETTEEVWRDADGEIVSVSNGGQAGFIDPNTGSPEEELGVGHIGRESWRDLIDN